MYVYQVSGQMDLKGDLNQQDLGPVPIDTCPDGPFGPVTIGIQDEPLDAASNSDWISFEETGMPAKPWGQHLL